MSRELLCWALFDLGCLLSLLLPVAVGQLQPYSSAPVLHYSFSAPAAAVSPPAYIWTEAIGSHSGLATFDGNANLSSGLADQYIDLTALPDDLGNTLPSVLTYGSLSFELWLNLLAAPEQATVVFDIAAWGAGAGEAVDNIAFCVLQDGSAMVQLSIGNLSAPSGNASTVVAPQALSTGGNVWQHVVVAIAQLSPNDTASNRSALVSIYVNGLLATSAAAYLPRAVARPFAYINRQNAPQPYSCIPIYGQLDSFALYSYALDALAVFAHYTLPRTPVFEVDFSHDPHVASLQFNSSTADYNWFVPSYVTPRWNGTSNTTYYVTSQGTSTLVLNASRAQYVNLSIASGPHSLGTVLPTIGGWTASGELIGAANGWSLELTFAVLELASNHSSLLHLATEQPGADDIELWFDTSCSTATTEIAAALLSCAPRLNLALWQDGAEFTIPVIPAVVQALAYHIIVVIAPADDVPSTAGGLLTVYVNGYQSLHMAVPQYPRAASRVYSYLGRSADATTGMPLFTSVEFNLLRVYDYSVPQQQVTCLYSQAELDSVNGSQSPSVEWQDACYPSPSFPVMQSGLAYNLTFSSLPAAAPFGWYAGSAYHVGLASFDGQLPLEMDNYTAEGYTFPCTVGAQSGTFEWWLQLPDGDAAYPMQPVLELTNAAGLQAVTLLINTTAAPFSYALQIGAAQYSGSLAALTTGEWHHLTLRFDAAHPLIANNTAIVDIFVDGEAQNTPFSAPAPSAGYRAHALLAGQSFAAAEAAAALTGVVDSFVYTAAPLTDRSIALRSIVWKQPVYELTVPVDPRPRLGFGLNPSGVAWNWLEVDSADPLHTGVLLFSNFGGIAPSDGNAHWIDLASTTPGDPHSLGLAPMPAFGGPSSGVGPREGWSIELSVKVYSLNQWSKILSCGQDIAGDYTMTLGFQSGNDVLEWQQFDCCGTNNGAVFSNSLPFNVWQHFVVVVLPATDGSLSSVQSVYMNGQLGSTITNGHYPDAVDRYHCYLAKSTWDNPCFDGAMDAFRLYDYALSPDEISSLSSLALTGNLTRPQQQILPSPEASVPALSHPGPRLAYNFDSAHAYEGAGWYIGGEDPLLYQTRLGVATLDGQKQWLDLSDIPDDYGGFPHTELYSSFSVECWIKLYQADNASQQWTVLDIGNSRVGSRSSSTALVAGQNNVDNVYLTVSGSAELSFGMYGGAALVTDDATAAFTTEAWQHLVLVVNQTEGSSSSSSYAIYVQGINVTGGAFDGVLALNVERQHMLVGRSNVLNDTDLLSLQLDCLYLYDYALSAKAVAEHVWLPRHSVFELVFESDPRWLVNASQASTYSWNTSCGQCVPWLTLTNCTLLFQNVSVPAYNSSSNTTLTTNSTACVYTMVPGSIAPDLPSWQTSGVLLLPNMFLNASLSSYTTSYVDLTAANGSASLGAVLPSIGNLAYDASLGAVYTGWAFELEVQFHLMNGSQLWPSWMQLFSVGNAADNVRLGFVQSADPMQTPVINFQINNERADAGTGSGQQYALLQPEMDTWYHIIVNVEYAAGESNSAQYTAYINGVALPAFSGGTLPLQSARTFAYLGTPSVPVGTSPALLVNCVAAVNFFRVYDVAISATAALSMYRGLHSLPVVLPQQTPLYNANPLSVYTWDSAPDGSNWVDGTSFGWLPQLAGHQGVATFSDGQYIDLLSLQDDNANVFSPTVGGQLSLEFWLYLLARPAGNGQVLQLQGSAGSPSNTLWLRYQPCYGQPQQIVFGLDTGEHSTVLCGFNASWQLQQWQHVVVTLEQNTVGDTSSVTAGTTRLFVDGQQQASIVGLLPAYASRPFSTLFGASNGSSPMNVAVDSFIYYNTPLPPQAVLAHALMPAPALLELNFYQDPRKNYIANTTTADALYNWLEYDPMDAPVPDWANNHQGIVQLVQSPNQYRWIDLNAVSGPNSAGVTVPIIGGVSPSLQYSLNPGWSFEIAFKAGTRTSWAKMFCLGNGENVDNILIGWDGAFTTNLTISFQTFDQHGHSELLKVLQPTNFEVWYHIVVVVCPDGLQVAYVDGQQTNNLTNGIYPRAVLRTTSYLGKSDWVADSYFNMKLDTFRVYDYALNATQVAALYAITLPAAFTLNTTASSSSSSGAAQSATNHAIPTRLPLMSGYSAAALYFLLGAAAVISALQ